MTLRFTIGSILLVMFLGIGTVALSQAASLSDDAREALRQGQAAAARAMNSYSNHFSDQPLWREAIRFGLEAERLAPDRPEPARFLAQVYSTTKWYSRAWQAWQAFRRNGGELDALARRQLAEVASWLGYRSYSAGDLEEALDYYQAAYQQGDDEAIAWLGRLHSELGNPNAALPFLQEALRRDPGSAEYAAQLERAEHQLRYGVEASMAFFRGLEAYEQGSFREALTAFQEATRANDNFQEAFVYAGNIHLELAQPEAAIPFWERAVALDPGDEGAVYFLELARDQARWGVEAVNALREGIRLYEAGNRGAASERLARATSLSPNYAEAWAWRGRLAFEQGGYQTAESYYSRATALEPGNQTYASFFQEARRLAQPPQAVEAPPPTPPAQAEADEPATPDAATPPDPPQVAESPPPAEAVQPAEPAPATGGPEPIVLLDVTYTHTLQDASETSAFSFFQGPVELARNMMTPVNYASGTLRHRLEIVSKPSDKTVQYQLCLVPTDITSRPACTDQSGLRFQGPGVYEHQQPMPSLTQYANIDWTGGLLNLMLVVKDGDGNPVDGSFPLRENWDGSPDLSLYYPMEVRYTAILIPEGTQFSGWP